MEGLQVSQFQWRAWQKMAWFRDLAFALAGTWTFRCLAYLGIQNYSERDFMDFLWFPAPILRLIEGPKCNEKDDTESVQFQMSLLFVCMLFVNSRPSSTCLHSARPPRKLQPVICTYVPRVRFVCLQPRKTLHLNPEAKPQVPEAFETLTRFLHQSDTWQLAFGCLWEKIWKDHEAWASIHCKLYTGVWGAVFRCCFFFPLVDVYVWYDAGWCRYVAALLFRRI